MFVFERQPKLKDNKFGWNTQTNKLQANNVGYQNGMIPVISSEMLHRDFCYDNETYNRKKDGSKNIFTACKRDRLTIPITNNHSKHLISSGSSQIDHNNSSVNDNGDLQNDNNSSNHVPILKVQRKVGYIISGIIDNLQMDIKEKTKNRFITKDENH